MKRSVLFLFVLCAAVFFLCSCTVSDRVPSAPSGEGVSEPAASETAVFDETVDTPVRVVYQRNYFYSEVFETDDVSTIKTLLAALNDVRVLSQTNAAADDYEDIITFENKDGSTSTVRFEGERLLKNDVRYEIEGYDGVKAVLSSFADE